MWVPVVLAGVVLLASISSAQIAPINPPSGWKVPNGAGTCSVGKSCADLAPAMMQNALGASPLEKNLGYLKNTIGRRATGSPEAKRAVDWAVEAFRQAGVDEVHAEKFSGSCRTQRGARQGGGRPGGVRERGGGNSRTGRAGRICPARCAPQRQFRRGARDRCGAPLIHSSGSVPRRSIRFVLFTSEEQGMLGSWAYARAHHAELDRTSAAILFDGGIGAVSGYSLAGRKDALAPVREALAPLAPMGVKDFTLDARINADRFDFILEGILTLDPNQKAANERATGDTFGKADIAALKRQAGVAAITGYALADTSEPIARRQSRAEIEELLKETGLSEQMKSEGFWPAWKGGERGRKQ